MLLAMTHRGHGLGLGAWGWLLVGAMVLLVVAVAVAVYFRGRQPDGLSRAERRKLGPMTPEILAIVRQTGRPASQAELAELVSMDADDIAKAVQDLESRGLVRREWSSEQQTYLVTPA